MAMKTLIAAALGLLVLAPTAHADSLPKELLGKWCFTSDEESEKPGAQWTHIAYEWTKDCAEDGWLLIKQRGWTAHESGCGFTSVRTVWDKTIPVATKTPTGAWVAHIKAKCGGEGCEWRSNFVLYLSKGTLFMRGRSTKEVCNG
jgi:hypothetical protein